MRALPAAVLISIIAGWPSVGATAPFAAGDGPALRRVRASQEAAGKGGRTDPVPVIRVETEASARPDALVHAPLRRIEPGPLPEWGYEPSLWEAPERLTLLVLASQLFAEQQARIRFFHTLLSRGRVAESGVRLRRADGSAVAVEAEGAIVHEGATYVLRLEFRERDAGAPPGGPPVGGETRAGIAHAVRGRLFDQLAVPELGRTADQLSRFLDWVVARTSPLLVVSEEGAGATYLVEAVHESRRPRGTLMRLDADLDSGSALSAALDRHLAGPSAVLVRRLDLIGKALADRLLSAGVTEPPPALIYATARPSTEIVSRFDEAGADVFTLIPLRERRQDVLPVVSRLLRRPRPGLRLFQSIHPLAARALQEYAWPGNVTELKEVAESARLISGGAELRAEDLPVEITMHLAARSAAAAVSMGVPERAHGRRGRPRKELSADQIRSALRDASGNRAHAAHALGVSRTTLWRKMAELGEAIVDDEPDGA